jgi:hypothetical protein
MGGVSSFFVSKKLLPKTKCNTTCKEKKCEPIKKCEPVKCPTCKKCVPPEEFCKQKAAKHTKEMNEKLTKVYKMFVSQTKRGRKKFMIRDKLAGIGGLEMSYTNATGSRESGVHGT